LNSIFVNLFSTLQRMKNVIKREQCKLACGLPSVNILSKVSKFKVLLYLKKSGLDKHLFVSWRNTWCS